jgi:hypothetical protein
MHQNYLVLIGSNSSISGASTYGTGFLVSKDNLCYVVTCRHVIREAANGELFAIPKPKKTKAPPGGYPVLALDIPRFHPQDNREGIFDIAIAPVLRENRQSLEANEIVPLDILNNKISSSFREGDKLLAEGYPVEFAELAMKENRNEPLLPKQLQGAFRIIPLKGIPQHGFDAPLREAFFAQTKQGNLSGKGMSGGIVRNMNGGQLAGLVLASGEFTYSIQNQVVEKLNGFIFANANRILEAMTDNAHA